MKIRVSSLTRRELETAISEANLTPLQTRLVLLLNKEELNDTGIMMELHISHHKYYAEKAAALTKIAKVTK